MRWLLRLYPRAWRRRYGPEMEALLEETPPTLRGALDLARGAADARLHREWQTGPARRALPSLRRPGSVMAVVTAILAAAVLALRVGQPVPGAALIATTVAILAGTAWRIRRRSRRLRRGWRGPDEPGRGAPVPATPLPDAPPALAAAGLPQSR